MAAAMKEQRERERARVWVPLTVRAGGAEIAAVTYDASEKGVLMLTAAPLAVGARVTVTFAVPGAGPRTGSGKVVRLSPNADDPDGLWPHRVAVALDAAMEAFAAELGRLAAAHPLVDGGRKRPPNPPRGPSG